MSPRLRALAALSVVAASLMLAPGAPSSTVAAKRQAGRAAIVTVGPATTGPAVAPGFAGVSMPLASLESYAGIDPAVPNTVFVQLLRNLTSGERTVLRFGGDSADRAWWPIPGMHRPASVTYTLTNRWLQVARTLASTTNARLILGINLMANSPRLARAEAVAMIRGIGRRRIAALEVGNEPELYRRFSGPRATRGGRTAPSVLRSFNADFARVADALPTIALAGPGIGSDRWLDDLPNFMRRNPGVSVVTLHRYPLKRCSPGAQVTAAQLLSRESTEGLAHSIAASVASARSRGLPLRIDELSTVACGGAHGVSDTFASALWLLDTLPALARLGVAGVNIQMRPNSFNELFGLERVGPRLEASVRPEYYGLLLFSEAAPPGSRMLKVNGTNGRELNVWATRDMHGNVRVVLVNNDPAGAAIATVRIPTASGSATLTRLQAPGLSATGDVTIGGQSFGTLTSSGVLAPGRSSIAPSQSPGAYRVSVPAASAALLEVSAR